ncbi:MAG: GH25 family lysozyme [Lentilactobacillus sunkii]|jgi:hypothetical protein|uniref:GH25 family lysozyme n=1 Tax=Lentilactobacillus sunkii TaxID=481719 RepID=UPI002F35C7DF
MPNIFIDISSWQNSSYSYLKTFKDNGAKSAMVKLTDGTNYLNPKAGAQISNSLKLFGSVGAYHYFKGSGLAEARYFLSKVKAFGLDKSTVLGIDVEDPSLPYYNTSQINVFLRYLKSAGYTHVTTYGPGSWFQVGRIKRSALVDMHVWVAAYGVNQPGVASANAWQFTDNWHGVDASYDYDGLITGKHAADKPEYYVTPGLYQVRLKWLPVYNTIDLKKSEKRYTRYGTGSRFWATPVKYGKITRLHINGQGYVSSNKFYVKFLKHTKSK